MFCSPEIFKTIAFIINCSLVHAHIFSIRWSVMYFCNFFSGALVLLMPELSTRKLSGHGCKSRQMSSKPYRSLSSSRASGGSRSVIQCTICSKTFNNSSALAKHKLIHSEERRYVCSQCSKSFKRQDHL